MKSARRILLFVGGQLRSKLACALMVAPIAIGASAPTFAQDALQVPAQTQEDSAISRAPVVPQQVRYSGKLASRPGDTVEAVFRIYASPEGGDPLWTETQQVTVAEDGSYSVLLGSSTATGLPQSVFANGAARWLSVSIDRAEESTRTLLSSVPYAMESADAQSLAGRRASDFVTQTQLAQFLQSLMTATQIAPPIQQPLSTPKPLLSPGALTGAGTANYIPLWNGTYTQGNSAIEQLGANTSTTKAAIYFNGYSYFFDTTSLIQAGTATTATGYGSSILDFIGSVWSSTTAAPVLPHFRILTKPVGNNTTSPGATLNFQYLLGATTTNILSMNSAGVISFAPTQTFPGTINSISAASPITAVTTAGATTIGLDQTTLVSDITPAISSNLSGAYAQLGATNTFTQEQFIQVPAILNENAFEVLDMGTGVAILGLGSQSAESIGVLGAPNAVSGLSNSFDLLNFDDGFNTGVWADAPNNPNDNNSAALIATADNSYAGIFYNDSATIPTITVLNNGGGSTGNAVGLSNVMRIGGPSGTCGFNQSGSLSCTGQVKSIVPSKDGAHLLETYSVQSSENWMEDYGSAQLTNGSATVAIESAFANTVNTGVEYHVFLTPGGDCKGLYVTNKSPGSFEVHELGGGTASIPFDYKIVAKRAGLESQRLVDVTDRMKLEAEQTRLKTLPQPLQRPRNPKQHLPASASLVPAIKR